MSKGLPVQTSLPMKDLRRRLAAIRVRLDEYATPLSMVEWRSLVDDLRAVSVAVEMVPLDGGLSKGLHFVAQQLHTVIQGDLAVPIRRGRIPDQLAIADLRERVAAVMVEVMRLLRNQSFSKG